MLEKLFPRLGTESGKVKGNWLWYVAHWTRGAFGGIAVKMARVFWCSQEPDTQLEDQVA